MVTKTYLPTYLGDSSDSCDSSDSSENNDSGDQNTFFTKQLFPLNFFLTTIFFTNKKKYKKNQ